MLIRKYHAAIVGATGLIGREFVKILGQRDFPSASIHLFASDTSAGKKLFVNHRKIELRELISYSFDPIDIALFFAGSEVSQLDPEEARTILADSPGIKVLDDPSVSLYPYPWSAIGFDDVFIGHIRHDISHPNGR